MSCNALTTIPKSNEEMKISRVVPHWRYRWLPYERERAEKETQENHTMRYIKGLTMIEHHVSLLYWFFVNEDIEWVKERVMNCLLEISICMWSLRLPRMKGMYYLIMHWIRRSLLILSILNITYGWPVYYFLKISTKRLTREFSWRVQKKESCYPEIRHPAVLRISQAARYIYIPRSAAISIKIYKIEINCSFQNYRLKKKQIVNTLKRIALYQTKFSRKHLRMLPWKIWGDSLL